MHTVTIDNHLYKEDILYASRKNISISGLFEYAVRNFMNLHPVKTKGSILDSIEYKKALEAMDEITAGEQAVAVPADEDGRDARIEQFSL